VNYIRQNAEDYAPFIEDDRTLDAVRPENHSNPICEPTPRRHKKTFPNFSLVVVFGRDVQKCRLGWTSGDSRSLHALERERVHPPTGYAARLQPRRLWNSDFFAADQPRWEMRNHDGNVRFIHLSYHDVRRTEGGRIFFFGLQGSHCCFWGLG
jgi:hypothetical protein